MIILTPSLCGMGRKLFITAATVVTLSSCTKDVGSGPDADSNAIDRLVINEVFISNDAPDWIELYNPGKALRVDAGTLFLSDDDQDITRYELPEIDIPAEGHVLIWCDGADLDDDGIHADFALSGKEHAIHLIGVVDNDTLHLDELPVHGTTGEDATMGRVPDGSAQWILLSPATPGAPNEAAPQQRSGEGSASFSTSPSRTPCCSARRSRARTPAGSVRSGNDAPICGNRC